MKELSSSLGQAASGSDPSFYSVPLARPLTVAGSSLCSPVSSGRLLHRRDPRAYGNLSRGPCNRDRNRESYLQDRPESPAELWGDLQERGLWHLQNAQDGHDPNASSRLLRCCIAYVIQYHDLKEIEISHPSKTPSNPPVMLLCGAPVHLRDQSLDVPLMKRRVYDREYQTLHIAFKRQFCFAKHIAHQRIALIENPLKSHFIRR
jgi:hypothetical protein